MKIECIKADITTIVADAIVNAANTSLMGGGGVDGAIHRKGGKAILDDCMKIRQRKGGCKVGEAVITTAGKLPAQYVIHTVGPVWNGGVKLEADKLSNCYINSLRLAEDHGVKTIAFPNISTGIYRYPKGKAAKVAIESVSNYETKTIGKVIFVCFDQQNFEIYHNLLL
ncbi:MAG: O-acetyl-ADP-ribose deacetylase [Bacteroidota bacterium]